MAAAFQQTWDFAARLRWHALFIPITILFSVPMYWMVITSLKMQGREFTFPPEWIPDPVRFDNYVQAMTRVTFGIYVRNSLIVTAPAVIGTVATCAMAAYAFARLRFPGRNFWFIVMLSTLMLPQAVTLIPTFILWGKIQLINTLWPLIVPYLLGGGITGPFYIFLMRQFIMTLPHELDEAAHIDGAGYLRIFWSIVIPLARPAIVVVAIFSTIFHWNEFLTPLIYLHDSKKFTVSLGLRSFQDIFSTNWVLMMAASVTMTAPLVAMFFLLQRFFVQGIQLTGIAGR